MLYLLMTVLCWILSILVYLGLHSFFEPIALLASTGLIYIGLQFGKKYNELSQRRRELVAEALLWKIQGRENKQGFFPDFTPDEVDAIRLIRMRNQRATILFLRPFAIDNKIVIPTRRPMYQYLLPGLTFLDSNEASIEELLLRATPSNVDIIGIGNRIELMGPAKLLPSNSNWRDVFLAHLQSVKAVVSIPSLHPSTLWELEQIASSGRRSRTLMIFTAIHFDNAADPQFHLPAIRTGLAKAGWQIPDNVSAWSIALFDNAGSSTRIFSSPHFDAQTLRTALKLVMPQVDILGRVPPNS